MCTISFLSRQSGYALAMNRDEKLTRDIGLPPVINFVNGCASLSPSEPGGGTWIALNDGGVTFALINWYVVTAKPAMKPVSRGGVVQAVSPMKSPALATATLGQLPLLHINPFRLIGVFPAVNEILEWCWDSKNLIQRRHLWRPQQWISSGFEESKAQHIRGETFQRACRQRSAGSLNWLRRLHRSHLPENGPFSTCMHRGDAATVSYTEIAVSRGRATMFYHAGAPCRDSTRSRHRLHMLNDINRQ